MRDIQSVGGIPILSAIGISKRFGSTVALDDIHIDIFQGQVHAILGENGAGKTTLVSILSGAIQPDKGIIKLNGNKITLKNVFDARNHGISLVHQHFALVPAMTIEENLALASPVTNTKTFSVSELSRPALELAKSLDWILEPNTRVENLSVGEQQRIEIIKALVSSNHVLLLDEPTASLTKQETVELFRVIEQMKQEGRAVIFITHKLEEVKRISDKVTVLKKGKVIAKSLNSNEVSIKQLADYMVGDVPEISQKQEHHGDAIVMKVKKLKIFSDKRTLAIDDVSFQVHKGEIFGIGGVDGNGQVELAEVLAGIRRIHSGVVLWKDINLHEANIKTAYIPQDRQADGLALNMSITDNLLIEGHKLPNLKRYGVFLFDKIRKWCEKLIDVFQIKVTDLSLPATSLSGGNQQKIVVARILDTHPHLLVAVNPTRGLDIMSTQFVYEKLLEAKNIGCAIVLISTDLDELSFLSDRFTILSKGKLLTGQDVGLLLGGVE